MRKYLPTPHKSRPKTLDSTDTVDFTHFRRTVNRYCDHCFKQKPVKRNGKLHSVNLASRTKSLTILRRIFAVLQPNSRSILRFLLLALLLLSQESAKNQPTIISIILSPLSKKKYTCYYRQKVLYMYIVL